MSMTENEAIEKLQTLNIILTDKAGHEEDGFEKIFTFSDITAICTAIQALEEIQQYRAIETELKEKYHANVDIKMLIQHFIETIFKGEKHEGFCILTNEDAKMWDEYRAIGTIDEFKALKEKRTAKSRRIVAGKYFCPECGRTADMGYCKACGQNLY